MIIAAALLALPAAVSATGAGGVTGPAFYVDGELYRTVGTPTDLSHTGAPAHSFDTIYAIDGQRNVATAAPGDRGFNGGRWRVRVLEFNDYPGALVAADVNGSGDLDSAAEVDSARAAGFIDGETPGPSFVCPVIKVPRRG
jgi:hypothetical protein